MNLDDNTKWIIEKTIVVGVAVLGLLGSGKFMTSKEEPNDPLALIDEQRAILTDLKERLHELEDSAARKDRFIIQLLHDCQTYQRTINDLERDLHRPPTQWEINVTDEKVDAA